VIDPRTLLATIPQASENRNGETWQSVLEQYPNLEFVVSDQANGLRKGVNDCGREIAHQYGVFHYVTVERRQRSDVCMLAATECEKGTKVRSLSPPRRIGSRPHCVLTPPTTDFDRADIVASGESGDGWLQMLVSLEASVTDPSSFTQDPKSGGPLATSLELIDNSTVRTTAVWLTAGFFEVAPTPKP